jgi:Flp pilus assembly protein TadD
VKARKFIPLLVVAAGLLAYYNSFTGPFVFDDGLSIRDNRTIRHLWPIWQTLSLPRIRGTTVEGRPLVNLSFAINYALGGYHVWGYHALNLAIHILAALTLLGIVRRTLLQPRLRERFGAAANGLALATAVIWTVHPLQTESVTYLVQRTESLMGLFYLLTMYCFIRGAASNRPWRWYGWCVTACALGIACKEVMVSAPLMVMLYDRTFLSGSFREAWRPRRQLYLALAGTWILLAYLVSSTSGHRGSAGFGGGIVWWQYALTQSCAITRYLALTVWPRPLVFDYGSSLVTDLGRLAPCILTVGLLVVGTAISVGRWPALGFLGCWFFAILAPSSSVVPVVTQTMAEHRMYLPLAAVVVLGVMGIHALVGRQTPAVVVALVIGLGFLTVQRNEDYRSELAIWNDTVAKRPDNARARKDLGATLVRMGRLEDAIAVYEETLRIEPDDADARSNLALALWQAGKAQEAMGHWEQALRSKPDDALVHYNLGLALEKVGRMQEAIEHLKAAVKINPDYAEAHYQLGSALVHAGNVPEAMQHWEQALRINPDYVEAHFDLGVALVGLSRKPEAMDHWKQALRIKPDFAEAHYNLGLALERSGKPTEAIQHYQQALQINPDYAEARNALARLHASQ